MFSRSSIVLIMLSWSLPAAAYIDPGSGSAIMSAVIGFLVASWLVVKTYWYKIKSLLGFNSSDTIPEEDDVSDSKTS